MLAGVRDERRAPGASFLRGPTNACDALLRPARRDAEIANKCRANDWVATIG
jgi:hypothetical protein